MATINPPNAAEIRRVVEERLDAVKESLGNKETATIEWRGQPLSVPVITMPVGLLTYNPGTHRIRAQRTLDAERNRKLDDDPFGEEAQKYLHQLLMCDPTDPTRRDRAFDSLMEDLKEHGQNEPGLITRSGVLVNGNTRRAALLQLGAEHIRVGVLPIDAGIDDLLSIELSLQLRKDHKRDYSFMNFLLAIEERLENGRKPAEIQRDFRIKATTFEQSRWILALVNEAIKRSERTVGGKTVKMRLVDFENDQGKLQELYRGYTAQKRKSPEDAEALKEQWLLAIALRSAKTDARLIEPDFTDRYMKVSRVDVADVRPESRSLPGTNVQISGPSQRILQLKARTDAVLQARAVESADGLAGSPESMAAAATLRTIGDAMDEALTLAGKSGRIIKRRLAPADRLSDACDDVELAIQAVSEARGTGNFVADDLDESLRRLRGNLYTLAQLMSRGVPDPIDGQSDGLSWLRELAKLG